jgi:predicted nuclease with TOPRIM domain
MARGLGEKLKGAAGGGDELRQMHEKLVKTHEQLQDRFQDIRRRFAEQQERIERLEQEVRRLHQAHGAGRADGEKRDRKHEEKGAKQSDDKKGKKGDRKRDEKGAKQRDAEKQGVAPGAEQTPNVSYEGEESASL